jgi:flavin-dependent dehydrogenase
MHYDVIIAGAGPAGSSCARTLSDKGIKVLLIDKEKFPRNKVCCGLLTNRVVDFINKKFGKIPEELISTNRDIDFLWTSTGINYNKVKGYGSFINTYRDKLDHWLANKSNAEFIDQCELVDVIEKDDKNIKICCTKDNELLEFNCNYLVCCTGANSEIRKKYDPGFSSFHVGACIQKVFKGSFDFNKNSFCVSVNRKFTDSAFSYFYFKDDLIYIGSGWLGKYYSYLEKWISFLNIRHSCKLEQIRDERCPVEAPSSKNGCFFGKGKILFAGEAAGLMEHWGIGIPTAMVSGEKAAQSIICHTDDLVQEYTRQMESELTYIVQTTRLQV